MDQPTSGDCAAAGACPLTRRVFLERSTLAAVAALLAAACGDVGPLGPDLPEGGLTIQIADYPALASVGGIARVDTAGAPIAVVRTADTEFLALSMRCPHQGATLSIGSGGLVCPQHGARFDETGHWVGGQRTTNLTSIATSYDAAAGELTIGG